MIEYNANGIGGFALLLKKFFSWMLVGGKDWLIYLGILLITNVKVFREWTKKTIHKYFVEKDLSSQELNKQVKTLTIIMRTLQFIFGVILAKYLLSYIKNMLF